MYMKQPELNPPDEILTVCGGRIDNPEKYPSALYKGRRVFFCTRACLRVFESDPDRFMAGEMEHPAEDE
jgi:YHS domain-containing protein